MRISDWSSDVCSSDLTANERIWCAHVAMVLETDRTCRADPFGSLLLLPIYALEGIKHTGGSGRQAGWEQSGCHIPPDRHSQHYNGCGRYWSRCRRVDWLSKHERWRSGADRKSKRLNSSH